MRSTTGTYRLNALAVLAMAVLACVATGALAQSDEVLTLDIEPQEAGSALVELSRASGVQIMLASEDGTGAEVQGLTGEYRFEEALAALLSNTGLTHKYAGEDLVVIQEVEETAEPEEPAEAISDDAEDPLELPAQTVTGTRLGIADPTARVVSFTAEEISVRGVSSLEELFRTMPWAFPSITTQTNVNSGTGQGAPDTEEILGQAGLGISTVNMRAMGSANTLVLVNGRRVAGAAGYYGDFANLLDIPISAIERVDVQLDGTSAVYGSDAIGGIVNVILKKNYRGLSATVRHESSSSGADLSRVNLQGGYAWGRGQVTATAARTETMPIINARTGWTSRDYRDLYGPEYDLRMYEPSQPALVCEFNGNYQVPACRGFFFLGRATLYQLPEGHDGVDATVEDFRFNDVNLSDHIVPRNGEDAVNSAYTLYLEQYLTDNLRVYADLLYSSRESFQERATNFHRWLVPASNAYNPFGRHMVVHYRPFKEVESGLFPRESLSQRTRQRNYNAGFSWAFGQHELEINATRSRSGRDLDYFSYDYSRPFGDPASDRFYAALESSDPDEAINVFGDGSAQSAVLADFSTSQLSRGVTVRTTYEPLLRGRLMEIWGGDISYAVGAEFRTVAMHNHDRASETTRESGRLGIDRPERESSAYFAEFAVPLVGERNSRPGVRSLVLSLQARRDTYESTGSTGRDSEWLQDVPADYYVPGEGWREAFGWRRVRTGPLNHAVDKHSATSPRLGVQYKPVNSLILRASWSRSFRPPLFSYVFSTTQSSERDFFVFDYAHPSGTPQVQREAPATSRYGYANLDLDPESSDSYSLGIDWSPAGLPGLRWTVDWSLIDYTDRVEDSRTIIYGRETREIAYSLPQFVERDANGLITHINYRNVNIAGKRSEVLDTELQYTFDSRWGDFVARLAYNRALDESFQIAPGTPVIQRVGTAWGSDKYRLRGMLSWSWDKRIALDVFVQHIPGYENGVQFGWCKDAEGRCTGLYAPLPVMQVESLTTVDATLTYRFRNGLRVRGGGRNLFKATAPTIWTDLPYDPIRWDARGQVLFLEVNWEM